MSMKRELERLLKQAEKNSSIGRKEARGSYQRALLIGRESWSGSGLRGKAREYGGVYKRSRHNLLGRIQADLHEGPNGRLTLLWSPLDCLLPVNPLLQWTTLCVEQESLVRLAGRQFSRHVAPVVGARRELVATLASGRNFEAWYPSMRDALKTYKQKREQFDVWAASVELYPVSGMSGVYRFKHSRKLCLDRWGRVRPYYSELELLGQVGDCFEGVSSGGPAT